jgi:hypothetical protein
MRLERILPALFWLPIFLGGAVGVALVEPKYYKIGVISAVALGLFLVLVLLQAIFERKALSRSRASKTIVGERPNSLAMRDNPGATTEKPESRN